MSLKLHSDDFGYRDQANKRIIDLVKKNRLASISVLANMVSPKGVKALRQLQKEKADFKTNLHLNFIEGKSLEKKVKIAGLINKKRRFYPLPLFILRLFLGLIKKPTLQLELNKQLSHLKRKKIRITGIDSHQHTHALSPIAEIVVETAEKKRIGYIRSFKEIKTYSLRAKIIYLVLKTLAILSYFAAYKRFGLPATWKINNNQPFSLMSWEDKTLDIKKVLDKKTTFVIHPFLNFDSNKTYERFL